MNTVKQATENHVLTDAQLKTVDGAMTAQQRYEWHRARQEAFRAGEEWRIPRPGGGGHTPWRHPAFG